MDPLKDPAPPDAVPSPMTDHGRRVAAWLASLALLALVFILFFSNLGAIPFHTKGEPREALLVWELVHGDDHILPRRNGTELPSKPLLFHWLAGVAALLTGAVTEAAVRFPSTMGAGLTAIVLYWYVARRWGVLAGFCAAVVLATNFEWIRAARAARVDMVLAAAQTMALLAFEAAAAGPAPAARALFIFYFFSGLAVLAKGPVGVVLPALVALVYLAVRRDLGRLRKMHLLRGSILALGLPAVWYALAIGRGGAPFVEKQLISENLLRFVGESSGPGHWHPFYYYGPAFLAGFLPWSIFLGPLAVFLYHKRRSLEANGYLYPLVWFATIFVFYSIAAGKRSVYILAAYPAASLLVGIWWQQLISRQFVPSRAIVRVGQACAVLAAVGSLVLAALLITEGAGADPLAWISPHLHPRDQANVPLIQEVVRSRLVLVATSALVLSAAAALLVLSALRQWWSAVFVSIAVAVVGGATIVNQVFYPAIALRRTFQPFMHSVRATIGDGQRLAWLDTFDYGAVFYFQGRIPVVRRTVANQPADVDPYTHVLIGERQWDALAPEVRAQFSLIARSSTPGPKGDNHLLLARVQPRK